MNAGQCAVRDHHLKYSICKMKVIITHMKLLYTDNSPYARKVRILIAEKQLIVDCEKVVLADPNCTVHHYNPLGKVPVLILSSGECLYDSSVIMDYLDQQPSTQKLIPNETYAGIQVKRWEALADGICDAAVTIMLESRRNKSMQDTMVIQKQLLKVTRGLQVLERDLAGAKWCVNQYSVADIAVGCMLGYVSVRLGNEVDIEKDYPSLHALHQRLLTKSIYANTQPLVK